MKNEDLHKIRVTSEHVGERLDKFLSFHPLIHSRSRAAKLIDSGSVTINNKPAKASLLIEENDEIQFLIPWLETQELKPYSLKLNILFEDKDIIVLDKPAGLVVHPGAGHSQDTLVNALIAHTPDLSMGFNEKRPGIVHRIDKETSGLLVIAKNDFAHEKLAQQFKEKSTLRAYIALVHGTPKPLSSKIVSFLRRHPTHRKKFSSQEDGKEAITNYETLENAEQVSLLKLRLETGRTHQIRVHLSERGHPIVGDTLYGSGRRDLAVKNKVLRLNISQLKRFALHAAELGFVHPTSGRPMKYRSEWPEDLKILTDSVKINTTNL